MIDDKLPNSDRTIRSTIIDDRPDMYNILNENFTRALNEIAKFQPQYLQSISNLQLDFIQTTKNTIQNIISAQKQMASNSNSSNRFWNIPPLSLPIPYIEQFARQLNDFTNNTIKVSNLNNQFTITILDAIRENLNIYNRATDELSRYRTNMVKAWNSFFAVKQF
ncbi:MAG TPA: hypothetical protein VHF08_07045 [Nitrososphaeraceae archaeon]|nr:hypothetical protein [Nitrososphaeraceae archaeon]